MFYRLNAQEIEIKKSDKIEIIDGKSFYIHKVSKGQTLYSISKVYNVTVDELINENPETKNGLSINQLLKIPVNKQNESRDANKAQIPEINKDNYWIEHTVKSSETLFSIAKKYNTDTDDILKINPGLSEYIIPGQIIKIPVKKDDIIVKVNAEQKIDDYFLHTVKNNETLYSIAKSYLVSVEEIKEINPGLDEKIKKGHIIRIPVKHIRENVVNKTVDTIVTKKIISNEEYCKFPELSSTYNIALIMPFFLDKIDKVYVPENENEARNFESLNFIGFYEGAMMAIDTMKYKGMNIKLYVYDDDNDSIAATKLIQNPEIKKINLFIGPFFKSSFNVISNFAKNNNISTVNPLSPRSSIIKNNPNAYKVVPSTITQYSKLAELIPLEYPDANVIIVNNYNNIKSVSEAEHLKKAISSNYLKRGRRDSACVLINYYKTGLPSIVQNLKSNNENIVITLATGEIFFTNYIRNLRNYTKNYNILLFTQPSITQYENLELEYMQDLQLHIFSTCFVDYSRTDVKNFVSAYRSKYFRDPDYYAFAGYDISLYFLNALYKYGHKFNNCIDKLNHNGLQCGFYFKKTELTSGYENTDLSIYKLVNYNWVKVR